MRAELRDAKIAAAKAEGRVKPVTTLAQRRAARRAEKYRGWRVIPASGVDSQKRQVRRIWEADYADKYGRAMSSRQFRRFRKASNRTMRAIRAVAERVA